MNNFCFIPLYVLEIILLKSIQGVSKVNTHFEHPAFCNLLFDFHVFGLMGSASCYWFIHVRMMRSLHLGKFYLQKSDVIDFLDAI